MNNKNRLYATLLAFVCLNLFSLYGQKVSLSLIPPTTITNQVNLDIRAGIVNNETEKVPMDISIYLNKKKESALLHHSQITLAPEESHLVKKIISTKDKVGKNKIILVVKAGKKSLKLSEKLRFWIHLRGQHRPLMELGPVFTIGVKQRAGSGIRILKK